MHVARFLCKTGRLQPVGTPACKCLAGNLKRMLSMFRQEVGCASLFGAPSRLAISAVRIEKRNAPQGTLPTKGPGFRPASPKMSNAYGGVKHEKMRLLR